MEEPDADELAWMDSEQFPEDDYEEFNDEDDADTQLRSSHPAPGKNCWHAPVEEFCRKRILIDGIENSLIDQLQTTAKRGRSHRNVSSPPREAPTDPSSRYLPTLANQAGRSGKNDAVPSASPDIVKAASNFPYKMASSIKAGEFVTVTGPSGDRVYAKLNRSTDLGQISRPRPSVSGNGLLLQPIGQMFEQAETERTQKTFGDNPIGDLPEVMADQSGGAQEQLWVEKYAPKSFTDLLSDEQTNRQVLRWLKQWDPCVFGHKSDASTSREVLDTLRRSMVSAEGKGSNKTFNQDRFGSRNFTRDGPFKSHSDSWSSNGGSALEAFGSHPVNEIHEKVLLLCGPPGLGKTTLAHIAAKHCGYRIVEINASDDRVAATLQGKILDAVQMKSVTGDSRPNCLIIDEIDGAVGGTEGRSAIKQLIDIVTASNKKNRGSEDSQAHDGATKGVAKIKRGAIQSLSRPIICICNDLYAPALRPLRQISRIHMFSRPSASRVVTRLKYICSEEGFKTTTRVLTTLAEHAESDIRACLNTLQFLKRKGQPLTSVDVESKIIGCKDMTRSVYDIWGEVFRKSNSSKSPKHPANPGVGNLAHEQLQFLRIYDLIATYGDHDLAIDGIHENLLHTGYQDSSLSKTVACLHSICESDIRNKEVYSKQRYFVNGYQPSTPLAIRSLIAAPVRPNIQWPRAFQRFKTEVSGKQEMLKTWFNQMSPAISRSISISPLTLDLLSPLLTILSPPLRPVAVQLYTTAERETMNQLVDTMVTFGLTYKHGKGELLNANTYDSNWLGQGGVNLDPPVTTLVTYEGGKAQHRQLSTTTCQMLGHEIELERIRRESLSTIKQGDSMIRPSSTNKGTTGEKLNDQVLSKLFNPKHRQKESEMILQNDGVQKGDLDGKGPIPVKNVPAEKKNGPSSKVKQLQTVTHQATNFFDGWKKRAPGGNEKNADLPSSNKRDLRPLLYKFHEGFTNAIRRPMLVKEFL